jgi:hypothetical protein
MPADDPHRILESFELQADWCRQLGSDLYADLLEVAAADLRGGDVVANIVDDFTGDAVSAALPLRMMGAVHRLVLMGLAPDLAAHYPSVGGTPNRSGLADDFLATLHQHTWYVKDGLNVAPQTNDIGRSTALLAGIFSVIEREQKVRLLGLGSAGGLNLNLDRYRYESDSWQWGPENSGAVIRFDWSGPPPPLPKQFTVTDRRGCDTRPIDVMDPEQDLRLLSFIWPDQEDRFRRTAEAIETARRHPPEVDRADVAEWLALRLSEETPRRTLTVIQHSIMWQYLPDAVKAATGEVIDEAASRATRSRPLAHVSYEPPPTGYEGKGMMVMATRWPGGEPRELGRGHAHGHWFEWTG